MIKNPNLPQSEPQCNTIAAWTKGLEWGMAHTQTHKCIQA